VAHFFQYLTNILAEGLPANTTCTLSFWYYSAGSGTLNAYLNAGFRANLALGAGGGTTARFTPGAPNSVAASLPPLPPLYLNEVQPENLTGPADNFGEREPWIELHNAGAATVALDGLFLANQFTNLLQWPFPPGAIIRPGEYVLIWADGEPEETAGTNWHANFRLSATNGAVALTLAVSNTVVVLDYLDYAGVAADRSFGAWPEDQTSYRQTFHYATPRATNNPALPPPTLFLNEWMAANTRAVADPADGDYDDWFEIFNPNPEAVNLEGFFLTDNLSNPTKFRVPAGSVAPAQGFRLVWADEETGQTRPGGDLHVNFKLSQSGEALGLYAPDGTRIDSVVFGPQTDNVSQGRHPDGAATLYFMTTPTPRAPNVLRLPPQPPVLTAVRLEPGGALTFTFATQPGYLYQVEYAGNLDDANWHPLGVAQAGTGAPIVVADPVGALPRRFYRVRAGL
jgi:hypothetical protein